MNILNRAFFLLVIFLHACSASSLIFMSTVIYEKPKGEEKIGRKFILFGDFHYLGTPLDNQHQALLFFDFVEKLAQQDLNRPIVLLTESALYAPNGLSEQEFEDICRKTKIMNFLPGGSLLNQTIIGRIINDQLFSALVSSDGSTWIDWFTPSLLPSLKELFKKAPNVKIISPDPRKSVSTPWDKILSQQDLPLDISVMDMIGYPSYLIKRYKYPFNGVDIKDEEKKADFINKYLPYTLERIANLDGAISSCLNLSIDELYSKRFFELTEIEKNKFFGILANHNFVHRNDQKYLRETLFDAELLYEILSEKHSDPNTIFVAHIGAVHVNRITQALRDMDMVYFKNTRDYKNLFKNVLLDDYNSVIDDVAEQFSIHLQKEEPSIFKDIKKIFPDGAEFNKDYINDNYASVIEMIKNAPPEAKDINGYSLLGYLVDFQDTFLGPNSFKIPSDQVLELVKALLDKEDANPNIVDPDGMTPLIRSLYYLDIKLKELLRGKRPRAGAQTVINTHQKILKELVVKGADTQFPLVNKLLEELKITFNEYPKKKYPKILPYIENLNNKTHLRDNSRENNQRKREREEEIQDPRVEINDDSSFIKRRRLNFSPVTEEKQD